MRLVSSLNQELFGMLIDPDTFKTHEEIVTSNGFNFESHEVITEDGYILNIFRLYSDRTDDNQKSHPAVFMQHGIVDSADCWIVNYNQTAPAF